MKTNNLKKTKKIANNKSELVIKVSIHDLDFIIKINVYYHILYIDFFI